MHEHLTTEYHDREIVDKQIADNADAFYTDPDAIIDELMHVDGAAKGETVFIYALVKWNHATYADIEAIGSDGRTKEFRLVKRSLKFERDSYDTGLVEIPKGYVVPLGIAAFVLDDEQIAKYRKRADEFNSPLLANTPTRKLETLGGVRF
jgi:hypothetical protein